MLGHGDNGAFMPSPNTTGAKFVITSYQPLQNVFGDNGDVTETQVTGSGDDADFISCHMLGHGDNGAFMPNPNTTGARFVILLFQDFVIFSHAHMRLIS